MGRLLAIWRSWTPRRRAITLGATALAIAGVALAGYLIFKRPGDVSNPDVAFKREKQRKEKAETVDWPLFGYDAARTKYLPTDDVGPPFRKLWSWDSGQLIEFSPIVVDDRIYGMNNDALFFALDADTGKILWRKQPAQLNASSPAYDKGRLYGVSLEPGQAFALRAKDGKLIWRHPLPGRAESSPIVHKGKVIFGCECAEVIALDAQTGKEKWSTPVQAEVKAAPAIHKGVAYVGDYAGQMYAIDVQNGGIEWQASDQGSSFGRGGRFYSTPAVAFGRVYVGNVDGRVYSFEASSGELAWSQSTGDWVYGGVSAADPKGGPPAVYAGSFDGNAYAFNAESGDVIWSTDVGGIISGSGSIVGNVFYVANLGAGKTVGLDVVSGEEVFEFDRGEYNPAISDGRRLYITGYSSINALDPVRRKKDKGKKGGKKKGEGGGSGNGGDEGGDAGGGGANKKRGDKSNNGGNRGNRDGRRDGNGSG
jgi:outer membrane protein assembly factor BamB